MGKQRRANGEGSIAQIRDGRWRARLRYEDPITGFSDRAELHGRTRADALDKLNALKARLGRGESGRPQRASLREFLEYWLTNVAKPSLRHSTYRLYSSIVTHHVLSTRLANVQLLRLTAAMIQHVIVGGGATATPRTRELALVILRRALSQAVQMRLIGSNPTVGVSRPRVERKEMQVLTPAQVRTLLVAATADRLHALYWLAIHTGLRQGELLGLQWDDLDLRTGTLQVVRQLDQHTMTLEPTKSRTSRRAIPLGAGTLEVLRAHRERMEAEGHLGASVFCTPHGDALRASNLTRRSFKPLLRRAGLPNVRFHDLRHTAATLMLAAGTHPKIVSERLGHATVTIAMDIYQHALPSLQREAAEDVERLLSEGRTNGGQFGGQRPDKAVDRNEETPPKSLFDGVLDGSGCWTRTSDPLINSQLLYQLS